MVWRYQNRMKSPTRNTRNEAINSITDSEKDTPYCSIRNAYSP